MENEIKATKLKNFFKAYRQYYVRQMKRQYGEDGYIPEGTFNEFLEDIADAARDCTSGTSSGMLTMKANFSITVKYPSSILEEKPAADLKSIEIPIRLVDGSCGNKHMMLCLSEDEGYNLGPARFRNYTKRYDK